MKTPTISTLAFVVILFSCLRTTSADKQHDFLECLSQKFNNYSSISNNVCTPNNSSYSSILQFSIHNLRFVSDFIPKPLVIITPEHESHIPPVICCAKASGLQIRTRSGGHDYEGLSFIAQDPFMILDLINLSEITVDVEEKTAWVGSGSTTGSLYYRIAEKSPVLGFPAGICTTIGIGGHFSGGGYGTLTRKHGLAADHVIDARIIDINGRILDRKSMGEDLFWAIRGGGGASFGVILAWKVTLVDVPEKVTVFNVGRTLEQNATQLVHKLQSVAPELDQDLFVRVILVRENLNSEQQGRSMTIRATFNSLYLGGIDTLLPYMQEKCPQLGLVREDCTEMSWIQSILYFEGFPIDSPEMLLNRTQPALRYYKAKSDFVQKPIPESGLEGIWRMMYEPEAEGSVLIFGPFGGRMSEIPASATPFPHRDGNLYMIQYMVFWQERENQDSDNYISWMRRLYDFMAPYVSCSPRAAYLNYRDLDIGKNNVDGKASYAQASIWGKKYFKDNFDRLVQVKTRVDPENFFRNEQSIPPLR